MTKRTFSDLLGQLDDVEADGRGFVGVCPTHDDSAPSLRVAYNADARKVLIKCRVGCEKSKILSALGWAWSDLRDVDPGDLDGIRTVQAEAPEVGPGDTAALQMYLDRAAAKLRG